AYRARPALAPPTAEHHPRTCAPRRPRHTRGLRASPPHVSVLRPPVARPAPRPRHATPSRRRSHLGEPRRGVQVVQSPEGREDTRRGSTPPCPFAVRASERRLLPAHALSNRRADPAVATLPVPRPELTTSPRRWVARTTDEPRARQPGF